MSNSYSDEYVNGIDDDRERLKVKLEQKNEEIKMYKNLLADMQKQMGELKFYHAIRGEKLEKCISEHDFLVAKCDSLDRHAKEWHELFLKKESEVDILQQQLHQVKETLRKHTELHPASEWHEDMGDCIWWRMPIEEPPHCGNPLDSEWTEDYYTHFTILVEPVIGGVDNE